MYLLNSYINYKKKRIISRGLIVFDTCLCTADDDLETIKHEIEEGKDKEEDGGDDDDDEMRKLVLANHRLIIRFSLSIYSVPTEKIRKNESLAEG